MTQEDVALAAAGLPRFEFGCAMFAIAGDDSMWRRIRTHLLEYLLAEREKHQWASRVERLDGQRTKFAEELVELYLVEERRPAPFQAAPHLRLVAMRVEPEAWRKTISHQYAAVSGEFGRGLLNAEEHVKRKLKRPY